MTAFLGILLPIALVAGGGALLGRVRRLDPQGLTDLAFYILGPALIFNGVHTTTLSGGEIADIVLCVILLHGILVVGTWVACKMARCDSPTRAASVLAISFNNAANYGLPVLLFAFGERGFQLGIVYVLVQLGLQATVGVLVASWREGRSLRGHLKDLLRVPWLYAFLLALALRGLRVALPTGIERAIELLAQAAIPVQLLLLGVQLSRVRFRGILRRALVVSVAKLTIPLVLGLGLVSAFSIDGVVRSVLLVEAGMPTAVNAMILALHYDRRPDLVAAVVLVTTVGSVLTIGLLLMGLS